MTTEHASETNRPEVVDEVTLSVRPVDPARDAGTLWAWVTQERAAFWGLQDKDLDEVEAIYSYVDEQPHLAAYLVHVGGVPVALFQTYDPFVDEIGEHYDRRPGDLGLHLFLADDPARAGRTLQVMAFFIDYLRRDPHVRRLVVEPDARNEKSVALVQRVGFALGPVVEELPVSGGGTKRAQFAFLDL